ncbi:hypothetical protein EII18_03480 [Comamonadaceae bacterium OH3737_COT-264]|nr:hypothetical protein EII18_03480 [Comamonadaceae bacterium OH3737_COT-264]
MSWFKKMIQPAAASAEPTLLDWRTFTERCAQACQAKLARAVHVRWADDCQRTLVCFALEDGTQVGISPQGAFAQYQQAPERLEVLLAAIPAQVERLDYHRTPSTERIFPVIRNLHALWPDGQSPQGQDGPIVFPLAGDLALTFVLDQPDALALLHRSQCAQWDQWGLADEDAVCQLALENFSAYASADDRTRLHPYEDAPGLFYFELDQVYESSLILFLRDILDAYQPALQGPPVLAVPARHVLLLCGAQDAHALAAMQQRVRTVCAHFPYPISAQLYSLDSNGAIVLFHPPEAPGEPEAQTKA